MKHRLEHVPSQTTYYFKIYLDSVWCCVRGCFLKCFLLKYILK